MMAPGHSLMGATSAIIASPFLGLSLPQTVLATLIVAGAALMPDCDQPSTTFGRTFGPISKWITIIIGKLSLLIFNISKTKYDNSRATGHRKLTHTIIYNVIIALILFTFLKIVFVQYVVVAILVTLGIRGLFAKGINVYFPVQFNNPKKNGRALKAGRGMAALLGMLSILFLHFNLFNPLQLTILVFIGFIVHLIGDAMTLMGVPLFWPAMIKGQTWYYVKMPFTFETGGAIESNVITPITFLVFLCSIGLYFFII